MQELTRLIKEDMKPALGVTEPGAIAYAVASAKEYVSGKIKKVEVALNSGMYKNGYTCGIPNSSEYGNLHAAALGAVGADAGLGLQSLAHITEEDNKIAKRMVEEGIVEVMLDHIGSDITIDATVKTELDCCTVYIRGSHTGICAVEKNGEMLVGSRDTLALKAEQAGQEEAAVIHKYTFREILDYVRVVPVEEIAFIREAYTVNMELLKAGLESGHMTIGPMLLNENGNRVISEDAQKTAQLLSNGTIEARVMGLNKPAMSITGSGAHGIIAAMPLYACHKAEGGAGDDEKLLRATALSYLITMYIKEYSGKLSAFCGCGIAAGTGMACGLAFMRDASERELIMVIQNMASGLTGMICDGGNQGCAMKGIVAVDAAFRAVEMAIQEICIENMHGINGKTPEETMYNMGRIASPGMEKTEKVILEIMSRTGRKA